ncbi:MAG: SusC/RagA family TonB-linked outer membrane protein [Bacteroidales bacterium]|nr:SusC/RagA family TonB-linked outer membrane protein [Bacteroidales bacterium]
MKYIKLSVLLCAMISFFPAELWGQDADEITLESMVTDHEDNPVANAVIFGDGSNVIRYTDLFGRFTITVPVNSTLFVSADGFISRELIAEAGLEKIILERDSIGQMVNIAYTKVEKRDLPGAISILNPGEYINEDYSFSVTDGMTGRVGGLLWSDNIWGMEDALVMIDGIPRNFGDIRLDEVEQITILKGVNAVALYGSHAAKGVILITTKRGEANNRKVSVRASTGLATPKLFPEYLGSAEYMTLYNEARNNDGLQPLYDDKTINNYRNGNRFRYPDIDYYTTEYLNKYVYNNDVSAEFSGGNKDARFYSNLGWTNNSTLLNIGEGKNEGDNRFNVRGNVDLNINDFISSTIDVSAVLSNSRRGLVDYWNSAATLLPNKYAPLIPIDMIAPDSVDALLLAENSKNIIDGQYILGGTQENMTNPVADLYVGGYNRYISRVLQVTNGINIDLNRLLKGLSFHTRFNADYYNSYNQSINNEYSVYTPTWDSISDSEIITGIEKYGNDARPGTQNIAGTAQTRNLGFSMQFNYLRSLNEIHNLSAILLASGTSITRSRVYQPSTNTNLGLQLGYNYDHRYWVDFSGALVNSTKLPEGNRSAFSPTISLGWLMSSEDFLAGASSVDHLKLNASAGIVNTDLDIQDYYLYENIYTSQGWFSWYDAAYSNQAATSMQGANPDLSFVKRKEFNVGIEGAFFKRLICLQTTFFLLRMDGLPTQRFSQYPNYFSTLVPYTNYNSNQYTGVDVMLNINKKAGEIDLNLGINATYASSKAIKRDELYTDDYQNRTGRPVDAIFGLVSDGFFMDETEITSHPKQAFGEVQPGDIKYTDQNGDNIIDERDEVEIGRWIDPFHYGLNLSATYKNITIFMLGTGSTGGNGMKTSDYYWVDGDNKYSEVVLDRWTEATRNTATFPRLSSQQNSNNFRYSDFWMYKSNRFNLSKVQITYNLPSGILSKTFVRALDVYAMGSNLFTFSKNKDIMDLNIADAPRFRYYNLGIRISF